MGTGGWIWRSPIQSNNVSILLGNGDGTFGAATNFAVGNGSFSVAAGDFNGDGKQDLAVPNQGNDNVSVLLGNGNGAFGAPTNFSVGDAPQSVAVGDFNGDGRLDLVVVNMFSDNVSILLNTTAFPVSGAFGLATNFAVGDRPRFVAVGDFNRDGKQDLAAANSDIDNVSTILGNGNGTFGAATNFAVGDFPISIAVGDFNGDGRQDLAMANEIGDDLTILFGDGNGNFRQAPNFPGQLLAVGDGPSSVAVGDFNGDGRQDLAVANRSGGNLSILLGNGNLRHCK